MEDCYVKCRHRKAAINKLESDKDAKNFEQKRKDVPMPKLLWGNKKNDDRRW